MNEPFRNWYLFPLVILAFVNAYDYPNWSVQTTIYTATGMILTAWMIAR